MFTRVLTDHEYRRWDHPNPDLRDWWRWRFGENVAQTSVLTGEEEYEVRRPDETVLYRGVAMMPVKDR